MAERARQHSLAEWARRALRPAGQRPAAHHKLLLQRLEHVAEGGCDRLMVLMPPGSAKSTYASLIFPAWWLHRHPRSSVIAASHTADLAAHFGRGLRNLALENKAFLGFELQRDSHAAHRFATDTGGEYFATGLGGGITGRRADLVLIDDPIKSHAEADSAAHRDLVWNWYRSELLPRLKPRGRVVLIMTRWHQDDLGGRLLQNGDDWTVLRLPALAEADDPLRRRPGEALWPQWEDRAALERKRAVVGPRVWAALYQQTPRPDGGALFRVTRIDVIEAAPAELRSVRAWDLAATAAGEGRDPDWTVGLKLGRDAAGRIFVLDVVRLRGGPHEVADAIVRTARQDGRSVAVGLPQDPGQAGKQQVAWLTTLLAGHRVVASPETGAKLTRAGPVAAQVEAGNLSLLRATWNRALLDELREFPQARKDDQVDALSRAFAMLAQAPAPARRLHVSLMAR
ncbi:phage terminase large subunit [Limobrevibacterium gyesilva]|uniref:Phage terminase large subunit n=1 Tax=Limobrevibacterium gyesilva TaxID=2991712 RepID=A0AA42CG09_9PROT|nr:phage terminase large subunit [Limobrevibacterium gyesilva]MCW3477663.1 phage terminase large subunit [Limobrevibacterium gyesilva]